MYSENFVSKKLKTFAQKNDWLVSGEYIYGEEQGYLFTGMDSKGQKTFITPVPGITDEQKAELFEVLAKNKQTMKLDEFEVSDDFLCIRIKDSMSLKPDELDFILALLVGSIQEVGIVAVDRCQECGKMDAGHENFIYDLYCYMHEDCARHLGDIDEGMAAKDNEDRSEDSNEDSSEYTDENSESDVAASDDDSNDAGTKGMSSAATESEYLVPLSRKITFTVIGAVAGSIPWLFLPFIIDLVNDLLSKITQSALIPNFVQSLLTCVCAYLVSYFAIEGYKLSKSKLNIKGRWIIGITSVITVIVAQFAYLAVLIIKEPGVEFTFSNYISNLTKFNLYINMLLGVLIGVVFTLIAILPFFDNTKSSSDAKTDFLARKRRSQVDNSVDVSDDSQQEDEVDTSDDSQQEDAVDTSDENGSASENESK